MNRKQVNGLCKQYKSGCTVLNDDPKVCDKNHQQRKRMSINKRSILLFAKIDG